MCALLKGLGYEEIKFGKAAGSRLAFIKKPEGHIIRLHRPHPGKIMKRYQLALVDEALRAKGIIK